jgi:hypothetical protein
MRAEEKKLLLNNDVWRTVQHHLPALKAEVEGLLAED